MSITKSSEFDQDQVRLAQLAKAMAHPARLNIMEILASKEEGMCGNIANILPLAQSTVSQHLKVLKEAGLIEGKISGSTVCYDLNVEVFMECCDLFEAFCIKMLSGEKCRSMDDERVAEATEKKLRLSE